MVLLALAGSAVQLVPDGTILIHIGLILLMIWILNRTFYKPVGKMVEGRESRKGGRRGPAGDILDEVAAKEAKYSAAIKETRLKGYETVSSERDRAMAAKSEAVGAAKRDVGERAAKESAELAKQTEAARAAIVEDADRLAEKISSSILSA